MAPVIEHLRRSSLASEYSITVISSGQHKELLQDATQAFDVRIDLDLNLMKRNQTSIEFLYRAIEKFDEYFNEIDVSMVVVHGDTGTAMAAAMSAHHNQIPVAHIEAGLRSGDIWAPWPEESNRLIVDSISSIHFAPTKEAANNLIKEGHTNSVHITGNTVVDSIKLTLEKIHSGTLTVSSWVEKILNESKYPIVLVTQHRRENFGESLENVLKAIEQIANSGATIVFPVHPNPYAKKIVKSVLSDKRNIHLIDSLSYVDLVYVLSHSKIVITDSGGLQEEGPTLGIPVLVTREKTERPEGIVNGSVRLVGTSPSIIFNNALELLTNEHTYREMSNKTNPYGDGKAAQKIVNILSDYLS
jgi:UDP-N-acetylglucosamine 2-epimerase (non-hydrolysing)